MSRYVPDVYDRDGTGWRDYFTPLFCERFNGLMIEGNSAVGHVFTAAFPSAEVIDTFLARGASGDLLLTHHPVDCRSGDPKGAWGQGFVPITVERLERLRASRMSVYSCHAPMDVAEDIGTTASMVEALGGDVVGQFWPYGPGHAGRICLIMRTSADELVARAQQTYEVPYVERAGASPDMIDTVAVVAGVGDHVEAMKHAEDLGARAYVTGELHVRIEGGYGRAKYAQVQEFAQRTRMLLVGVSHAASEHLVMRTQMPRWFRSELGLSVTPLPEARWWR